MKWKLGIGALLVGGSLILTGCGGGGSETTTEVPVTASRVTLSGVIATSTTTGNRTASKLSSAKTSQKPQTTDFDTAIPPRDIWTILVVDTSGNYCGLVAGSDGTFDFDNSNCDESIFATGNKVAIAFVKIVLSAASAEVIMLTDSVSDVPMLITLSADVNLGKVILDAAAAYSEAQVNNTLTVPHAEDARTLDRDGDGKITQDDAQQLQIQKATADAGSSTSSSSLVMNSSDFFGAPGTWYLDQQTHTFTDSFAVCNEYMNGLSVGPGATTDPNYNSTLDSSCYPQSGFGFYPVDVDDSERRLNVTIPVKVKGPAGKEVTARKTVELNYHVTQALNASNPATITNTTDPLSAFYVAFFSGYADGAVMDINAAGSNWNPVYTSAGLTAVPGLNFSMNMGAWGSSEYTYASQVDGILYSGELETDSSGAKSIGWNNFKLPLQMKEGVDTPLVDSRTERFFDEGTQTERVVTLSVNQTVNVTLVRDTTSNVPKTIAERGKVLYGADGVATSNTAQLKVIKVKLTINSVSVTDENGAAVLQQNWPIWMQEEYGTTGAQCFYILSKYGIDSDAASCTDESDWATGFKPYRWGEIDKSSTGDISLVDRTPANIGGAGASTFPDVLTAANSGNSVVNPRTTDTNDEVADWIQYTAENAAFMDFIWQSQGDAPQVDNAYAWIKWPNDGTSPLNPDPWNETTKRRQALAQRQVRR